MIESEAGRNKEGGRKINFQGAISTRREQASQSSRSMKRGLLKRRGTREATIRVKSLNLLAGRRSWPRAKRRAKRKTNAPQFSSSSSSTSSSSSDGNLIFALFTIPTATVSSFAPDLFPRNGKSYYGTSEPCFLANSLTRRGNVSASLISARI